MGIGGSSVALSLTVAIAVTTIAPAAEAEQAWTSLFEGTSYEGSGWSTCPEPIRVTVDTRSLKSDQRQKAKQALTAALARWNRGKFVTFDYGGELPVTVDAATGVAQPSDGILRPRHIYFTVKTAPKGTDLAVVGLAGPLHVDPSTRTIVDASAVFQAQYVNAESKAKVGEVFAHEIGHIIGLGHSSSKKDLMYPILQGKTDLGPGDIAGAKALLKPCPR